MKVVYALVFLLPTFAATAESLDGSMMAAYSIDNCSWEITEQNTVAPLASHAMPKQLGGASDEAVDAAIRDSNDAEDGIAAGTVQSDDRTPMILDTIPRAIVSDPTKIGDDAAEVGNVAGPNEAADISVGAIQAGNESQAQQSTIPARIVVSEPTITKVDEVVEEGDEVTITGANDAGDSPVVAVHPSDETQALKSTVPAFIIPSEPTTATVSDALREADEVATRGRAEDIPSAVTEAGEESKTMPTEIVASEPTIQKRAEAVDETDGIVNERAPTPH